MGYVRSMVRMSGSMFRFYCLKQVVMCRVSTSMTRHQGREDIHNGARIQCVIRVTFPLQAQPRTAKPSQGANMRDCITEVCALQSAARSVTGRLSLARRLWPYQEGFQAGQDCSVPYISSQPANRHARCQLLFHWSGFEAALESETAHRTIFELTSSSLPDPSDSARLEPKEWRERGKVYSKQHSRSIDEIDWPVSTETCRKEKKKIVKRESYSFLITL